ncbi:MAG: elongation factor 1-beta [Halobacteriota archaeon]
MGKVAAQVKVMPTGTEVDLDELEADLAEALPEGAELTDVEREDVAFGLVALISMVVVPDEAGGTEAVEEAFGGVDSVESVSVESVTRL